MPPDAAPQPIAYAVSDLPKISPPRSRRAWERYIAAGRLPSRKIGGRRVVLRTDLLRFLARDQPPAVVRRRRNADSDDMASPQDGGAAPREAQ